MYFCILVNIDEKQKKLALVNITKQENKSTLISSQEDIIEFLITK